MQKSTISNRLKKNYQRLKSYLKSSQIEAYRLYYHDIPEFPFYVDILKDHVMVYDRRIEMDFSKHGNTQLDFMLQSLDDFLLEFKFAIKKEKIHIKLRKAQKDGQYEKLKDPEAKDFFPVSEGPFKFLLNCESYLDYGLFLDHRHLRQVVHKQAKAMQGSHSLNLFSYTGAISVALALGGSNVTSIDLSNTYLEWAQSNFKLNNIGPTAHPFIQADIMAYVREGKKVGSELFDFIVCDPPSFSNSKRMKDDFEIQLDQTALIQWCMSQLLPSGILYFSNNLRDFKLDPILKEHFKIEDITVTSTPLDFSPRRPHWAFKIRH